MTYLSNDPANFRDDVIDGFALAHPDHVTRVPEASGFRRSDGPLDGKVTLLIGGGSGHYPSYNGVIGAGFADAAVLGDVFTSPAAEQVHRIARAAEGGAGVILAFGNYAGDRMNFGVAAERLRAEGIDTRVVWVTDDIASAPPQERASRRGIAGTFTVYKIAGASAERGDDLDTVERWMRHANDRTHTIGVAFDGCTMPGATEPLFHVENGSMDVGLGIHGEPGVKTTALPSADELADELVGRILAERPSDADGRAAVLVNGLGATKYEELYLLFGSIAERLTAQGVVMVQPEVGELVTSLDMAGCSLSVTWLDDDLEQLWTAPADTPAYRRGTPEPNGFTQLPPHEQTTTSTDEPLEATADSRRVATTVVDLLHAMRTLILDRADELGRLDAVAGDGDHGRGMSHGVRAAVGAAEGAAGRGGGAGAVLQAAGLAWADGAGGTSGILWGVLLSTIGRSLGDEQAPDAAAVSSALTAGARAVQDLSGTSLGDKSLLDALFPFVEVLEQQVGNGTALAQAWRAAAERCTEAARATADLVPKVGRARPLAERSAGTPDPGATSLAMIAETLADALDTDHDTDPKEQ